MPRYCVGLEYTQRVSVEIEADNDGDAHAQAERMLNDLKLNPEGIISALSEGNEEFDMALVSSDTGKDLIRWGDMI